jgi:hypothetical protein
LPRAPLDELRDDRFGGRADPRLVDELCLSWLRAARELLESGTIGHPTIVDLVARELLDFPLEHRSLCSYLTRERVKAALRRGGDAIAEAYAGGPRDFYS